MKQIIFIALICTSSLSVYAGDYFDKKYELQLTPNLGWSNFDGFVVGLDASLAIPLSERWQWKFGGDYELRKRSTWKALTAGAVYNFSDDWSGAYYLGAGVGLANERRTHLDLEREHTKVYGYLEFGKRFRLNKEGTLTWNPHITIDSNTLDHAHIVLSPVTFGWSF